MAQDNAKQKKKKKIGFAVKEEEDPEAKLLWLFDFSELRFRSGAQRLLTEHKELIHNISAHLQEQQQQQQKDSDGDEAKDGQSSSINTQISRAQFIQLFDGKIGSELCSKIFTMILRGLDNENDNDDADSADTETETVTQFEVIQFLEGQNRAKHVRAVTEHDGEWVLHHLKGVQFSDLDADGDGKIVLDDFYRHFGPLGLSEQRIFLMFQILDKNRDKKVSVMEFESWRRQKTASDMQKILSALKFDE